MAHNHHKHSLDHAHPQFYGAIKSSPPAHYSFKSRHTVKGTQAGHTPRKDEHIWVKGSQTGPTISSLADWHAEYGAVKDPEATCPVLFRPSISARRASKNHVLSEFKNPRFVDAGLKAGDDGYLKISNLKEWFDEFGGPDSKGHRLKDAMMKDSTQPAVNPRKLKSVTQADWNKSPRLGEVTNPLKVTQRAEVLSKKSEHVGQLTKVRNKELCTWADLPDWAKTQTY
eukprot:gnl/MRDRNA2_/MRDRNA2_115051_c0_seq1.p1 gnl/MRDRNA2_/MRDRNA2_115051_c0~~gnl/MRDRNA2_/MRDRNA2_115051_c0_seq1.p1  ORF type:complete len:227 (+),score=43.04 gnl/MRDRNA2_/MRDRNA2_115051_c0_seq1:92-772(+)